MPVNLASPGIVVKEVDLTSGRIDPTSSKIGGIVAPFERGPVDIPVLVESENDLLNVFGKPYDSNNHYEYWLTASSFLAYGGSLRVVRSDDDDLKNAGTGGAASTKIKSTEHYEQLGYERTQTSVPTLVAKSPGSWGNGIRVSIIDGRADQVLSWTSGSDVGLGVGVTQAVPVGTKIANSSGGVDDLDGYFKGIVTKSGTKQIEVKLLSHISAGNTETLVDYQYNGVYKFSDDLDLKVSGETGVGATTINVQRAQLGSSAGNHNTDSDIAVYTLGNNSNTVQTSGSIGLSPTDTTIGVTTVGISTGADKFLLIGDELIGLTASNCRVNANGTISNVVRGSQGTTAGTHSDNATITLIDKTLFDASEEADITNVEVLDDETSEFTVGLTTSSLSTVMTVNSFLKIDNEFLKITTFRQPGDSSTGVRSLTSVSDWFDQQTFDTHVSKTGVGSTLTSVKWSSVANRPGTSDYASSRGGRFDEVHVLVIDGDGKITGNSGTILEKHLNLSKASDAEFSAGSSSYWIKHLKDASAYVFGGQQPASVTTGLEPGAAGLENKVTGGDWGKLAEGTIFKSTGAYNSVLSGGLNYDAGDDIEASNALKSSSSDIATGYNVFENNDLYNVDFLLMGSGSYANTYDVQAVAQKIIAVAEERQDAIAFISPPRSALLKDSEPRSSSSATDEILKFYSGIPSSSFAVLDSGYKYMYDRFNDTFRYVPLNGDIAGTCARNDVNNFPWFSPAGTARGSILNAVKLAYNPSKSQRDSLYSSRINPVIFSPGSGIILFGDKTALAKASAFDRINVRRLFIYLENAIESAARDQLFEFNDAITRSNFVNIIEPFLRDVQSKRGITEFVVVCDDTNNTASVIDNNEFIAEIYIKPTRSINFIGLTFIATRSGVAFEEIIGNV